MKNLKPFLFAAILLCFAQNSFSAIILPNAQDNIKPKTQTISADRKAAMEKFVQLTPEQYEKMRGKKLSFFEKIQFKAQQRKLKRMLGDEDYGFNFSGFILGFLLGPIGVIGAYIFSRDRNFRKWTWFGWLAWIALILVIAAASSGSGY